MNEANSIKWGMTLTGVVVDVGRAELLSGIVGTECQGFVLLSNKHELALQMPLFEDRATMVEVVPTTQS